MFCRTSASFIISGSLLLCYGVAITLFVRKNSEAVKSFNFKSWMALGSIIIALSYVFATDLTIYFSTMENEKHCRLMHLGFYIILKLV